MNLDIRTLAVSGCIIIGIFAVWLIIVKRNQKTYDGFCEWMISSIFLFISNLLLSFRNLIDDFSSIVISNTLFILSLILIEIGVNKFFNRKNMFPFHFVTISLLFTAMIYFTYFELSLFARIVIVSGLTTVYCLRTVWIFLSKNSLFLEFKNLDIIVSLIVFGVWQIYAVFFTISFHPSTNNYMESGIFQAFDLLVTSSVFTFIYIGLVNMNSSRLEFELHQANHEISTLSRFLPICANCKKVRDDKGYWENVEDYISHHSSAKMTHSICPECTKIMYPELNDQNS